MRHEKFTPREDYREQQRQRAEASVCLSQRFRELKSLTVEFGYFSQEGLRRNQPIKYTVNTDRAKSVFRLDCVNNECVCGDFDLSEALAQAVATRQATATGEMRCQGWLSKTAIDRIRCHTILRYKLSLEYEMRASPESIPVPVA